ncbi:hypothetical protein ACFRMQ_15755 [Kitasatospora sp. NPDC056783]|uniref:Imm32 family immunity protein n=1 Tax=Kitasatospora sp. NPDC056783 TaxID=3345943 RepID=UPI003682D905
MARAMAEGKGFLGSIESSPTPPCERLAGVEISETTKPGVLIRIDSQRQILAISGDPVSRSLFADQLDAMTSAMATEAGGHRHIYYFPEHPYLLEGSAPLVLILPG